MSNFLTRWYRIEKNSWDYPQTPYVIIKQDTNGFMAACKTEIQAACVHDALTQWMDKNEEELKARGI